MTKWKHVINTSLLQPLMTQAFYDVLAIKPTYLGITLGPYYIEIMACRGLISCETETTKKMLMAQYIIGQ